MDNLIIERTQETPEINFDYTAGLMKISGRAYSSDISVFYKKMKAWLDEYITKPKETTVIEIQLDYYNSIFIKLMFYFLEKSKELVANGKTLKVRWLHMDGDDESVEDAARISKIVNLPFETVALD